MATASKGTMSFLRHARLGNKGLPISIWGGFGLPKCGDVFISSPSIQLSLGGLLSSRARFCFTGRQELKRSLDGVKGWPSGWSIRQGIARRLFDLRQRMANPSNPRRLFYLRQRAQTRKPAAHLVRAYQPASLPTLPGPSKRSEDGHPPRSDAPPSTFHVSRSNVLTF